MCASGIGGLMRIDLQSIDREQFIVQEHLIAGEICTLITPAHIGAKWTEDNLHLRSSLWDSKGEPVSLSYRKHHNWTEQPDLIPPPKDLNEMTLVEKVDGSTLCISRYRDTIICRTRGTVDASGMANGHEIAFFKMRYPKLFDAVSDQYTIVAEWVSPENVIVIQYPEPDLYLTNIIHHHDYSYTEQNHLDRFAELVEVKRPRTYSFDSVEQMLKEVEGFKGVEGICAYYPLRGVRDNAYRKAKGSLYLSLHRFKERATLPNTLDLFMEKGCPDFIAFLSQLERDFDAECVDMVKGYAALIYQAHLNVRVGIDRVRAGVENDLIGLSRRDAALAIQAHYSALYRGVAFKMLDKREIDDKMLRKLIEHELGL